MAKDIIVWCIEAPQSNFLREVAPYRGGQRLLFTDRCDDGALKFAMEEQAVEFIEKFGLSWLSITDHMILGAPE